MKSYKSNTPSMRHVCLINKKILSNKNKNENIKLLMSSIQKNNAGRNNSGHITVYTKCSRRKRFFRHIDYKRNIYNIPGIVYSLEYDPNRSSFISLIVYKNYICCYIIGIHQLNIGDSICSRENTFSNDISYRKGDCLQLFYLPISSLIHNLELWPKQGGIYIRSAGTYGKILKKLFLFNKVLIELPSKSFFYASLFSYATLGIVSNIEHKNIALGKAGRNRWLGFKSVVRGVAMNPVDHPHGGGEGKRSDDSFKKSPWGKVLKFKNRKKLRVLDLV